MSLTLTPEQERRLKAKAERAQKPVAAVLDDFLADVPDQEPLSPQQKIQQWDEMRAQWKREDAERRATMTPEEIVYEDESDAELSINLQRARQGKMPLERALQRFRRKTDAPLDERKLNTIAMLQRWEDENDALSDEASEANEADWLEFTSSINADRIRRGEEPLF